MCVPQDRYNYYTNNKENMFTFLFEQTHTRHSCLVLKLKRDCPFANRQISQDYNPNSEKVGMFFKFEKNEN